MHMTFLDRCAFLAFAFLAFAGTIAILLTLVMVGTYMVQERVGLMVQEQCARAHAPISADCPAE
jgi:hypothetical protein